MNRFVPIIALLSVGFSKAQVFDMLVSKTGPDAYRSVQSAVNRIPDNSSSPYRVFVKNGVYYEKVHIPASKTNVCLIGESVNGVIITYDDYSGKDGITTAGSYTFWTEGSDFYAENITFENSAGNVGQAVAIRTTGERQVFKNCRFLGFQDTYYAHKNRQYNLHCYVEGATDFIFGDATAVFDSCIINCVKGGQYITAPSDTKLTSQKSDGSIFYHGLLLRSSLITCNNDVPVSGYYLGRPWQPNASAVYINCVLDIHIKPEGWSIWSGTDNHLSGFYGEYQNRGIDGELIDTLSRVDWSHQISTEDAETYYSLDYFFKKEDVEWDPIPKTMAYNTATNLSVDDFRLTWWAEVPEGTGFVIFRNDSAIGFSDTTSFYDSTADVSRINSYRVKSVGPYGNLSPASDECIVTASLVREIMNNHKPFQIIMKGNNICFSESVSIKIYDMTGIVVSSVNNTDCVSLSGLQKGLYFLKAENKPGTIQTKKIIL
ncbi:MAG: T9SS type A sorting domain-containing protein [Bacteroidales bacterium]|nr:T9SS type A sorting domain-containing protein [Bacteroidales bacterium]MBN2761753.1 T9SS type A sorting domain-containing protein [Bacteroidales bacterium]